MLYAMAADVIEELAPEMADGIKGGADGSTGIQNIINQDNFPVLYGKRNFRLVGGMQFFPDIIPVESNVQLTIFYFLRIYLVF